MTTRRWRYTEAATTDIEQIIEESLARFGDRQALRYAQLIDQAVALAATVPDRPSSRRHPALGAGVRSLHVGIAAQRAGSASHIVFYRPEDGDPQRGVVVLRVLHERMDPELHLGPSGDDA